MNTELIVSIEPNWPNFGRFDDEFHDPTALGAILYRVSGFKNAGSFAMELRQRRSSASRIPRISWADDALSPPPSRARLHKKAR
jgi:hypothetical protein